MTVKQEAILGLTIWAKGILLMLGMWWYHPFFEIEGFFVGLLLVVLGVYLCYTAATDYFTDDFHDDIKKEYKP